MDLNTDFKLDNCFFGAVNFTKNVDPNKYEYGGYGVGFDACLQFSLWNREWGKNVVIFGVDDSSSLHADNRKKDFLVLGQGLTDGLDDTTIAAEANILLILRNQKRKFV